MSNHTPWSVVKAEQQMKRRQVKEAIEDSMTDRSVIINHQHYERFLQCPTCGAPRAAPCLSMRSATPKPIYTIHPGRPMRGGKVSGPQHRPYAKHPNMTTGVSVEDWLAEHGESQINNTQSEGE